MMVASQVFALILRHCRLTISPACADMTLLIRRVAHLTPRAVWEDPRWTRAVGSIPAHASVSEKAEWKRRDVAGTISS